MRDIKDARYHQFTPQERFSLTMSALARNDIKEADRLWDSCPRFNYKAIDFDYANRVIAINIITLLFFQKCVYQYNTIKMSETHLLLMAKRHLASEDYEQALERRDHHIAQLKSLYVGIRQFCEQSQIESNDFLKTIPEHVFFDIDKYLFSEIAPDQEAIEHHRNIFLEYWEF